MSSYSAPEHREALATTWEAGLRELLLAAEPGSDAQLTFVRAYAAAAHTTRRVGDLEGLLDGSCALEGLAVDQDLRWIAAHRPGPPGRADEDRIAAEEAAATTPRQRGHL